MISKIFDDLIKIFDGFFKKDYLWIAIAIVVIAIFIVVLNMVI